MNRMQVSHNRRSPFFWLVMFACALGAFAQTVYAADSSEPPAVVDALKSLKKLKRRVADAPARQAVYDLVAAQGDAAVIPALTAYKSGLLLITDTGLEIYGDQINLPDGTSAYPVLDALTGKAILGSDGKPVLAPKLDLTDAAGPPPRAEKQIITELISILSLKDADPTARVESIRAAGERATKAFVDQGEQDRVAAALKAARDQLVASPDDKAAVAAIDAAIAEKKTTFLMAVPSNNAVANVNAALSSVMDGANYPAFNSLRNSLNDYQDYLDAQQSAKGQLPKYSKALHAQLDANNTTGKVHDALIEATTELDAVLTDDKQTQLAALDKLGSIGTQRADNVLRKFSEAAHTMGDKDLAAAADVAMARADRYQTEVSLLEDTFAGLSTGSILILIALGLSIIFGLMGVINMAQGEFLMVGAFTTYCVSYFFAHHMPGYFDYYPIVAVPAAFLVSGIVGFLCELIVVRWLYGRPLETLLATWGISLILIQTARIIFGDSLSVSSPSWMQGAVEVMPDFLIPLNRLFIVIYCAICIFVVYFVVNRTKLGLLLRATTQNRDMANALGVATRRVDAFTFALGAGLAGLAGVAVPMYNKINPGVGQEYIVDCFMVVVVGGVGKLAGAIIAGLGLGFLNKYLEPLLSSYKSIESGASVYAKVIVLALIVLFLQWRPSGLFPPKGRMADA